MKHPAPYLFALFLSLLFIRLYSYHEPFSYDIPVFSVMANELLNGKSLYVDVWDHKPPLIYSLFAIAQLIAGYGPGAVYLLNAVGSLAILLGVYLSASRWNRHPAPGIWAAFFWVIISGDVGLQANQPKAELFLNAGLIWVLTLSLRLPENENRNLWAIGGLAAFVSLLKPHTILLPMFLIAGYLLVTQNRPFNIGQTFRKVYALGIPVLSIWGLLFLYFGITDRGAEFYEAVFTFNRGYAGSIVDNIVQGMSLDMVWPSRMNFLYPLFISGILAWIIHPRFEKARLLIFLYMICVVILIASPGRFFSYYYQLWLPILAVFSAELIHSLEKKFPRYPFASHGFGVIIILILITSQLKYYDRTVLEWAQFKDDGFVNYPETAKTINKILEPEESFFVWGPGPALYYYSKRRPPMRFVNHMPISGGPLQIKFLELMLKDLAKTQPTLVVINRTFEIPQGHPGLTEFFNHYRPMLEMNDEPDFKFYSLKDSGLQNHLAHHSRLHDRIEE